jgi:hypothetical protein
VAEVTDSATAAFRIDASTRVPTPNGFASLGQDFGKAVVGHSNATFL